MLRSNKTKKAGRFPLKDPPGFASKRTLMIQAGKPVDNFHFPTGPDMELVRLIHRDHDRFISFHRRNPENRERLESICSIPAKALPQCFGQLADELQDDSYFSIHGMHRGAHWPNRRGYVDEFGLPLPGAARGGDVLRYLTCCFADLDCHKIGLDVYDAIGQVVKAQDTGRLPVASIMAHSGRGLWLFWLLNGDDRSPPESHVRAWPERCRLWSEIQRAIGDELAAVGSDAQARDVARITRVPGSLNSKSGTPAGYWVRYNAQGEMPIYTLSQLAEHFRVKLQKPKRVSAQPRPTTKRERGIKGTVARWEHARAAFERLWQMRGGFGPGTRNSAVWCFTIILRQQRLPDDEIEAAIVRLFQGFSQTGERYTLKEALATMASAKRGLIRNSTMADMLEVTPEEAAVIGWPSARRFGRQPRKLNRREVTRQRREFLRGLLANPQHGLTAPALAELVEQAGLPKPSRQMIHIDLIALGIRRSL